MYEVFCYQVRRGRKWSKERDKKEENVGRRNRRKTKKKKHRERE